MSDDQIVFLMIGALYAVPLFVATYLASWALGLFESPAQRRFRRHRALLRRDGYTPLKKRVEYRRY